MIRQLVAAGYANRPVVGVNPSSRSGDAEAQNQDTQPAQTAQRAVRDHVSSRGVPSLSAAARLSCPTRSYRRAMGSERSARLTST